ncbi:pentatricopeptide repeat-containing protein At5g46100-like [Lotus japonicus]|uniref:pentatricopeptide repeat-containing protein At5g46100-like n=1 Tax=Lotus japonicus TaxID=34305 RepID=UPI0025839237|nr:pentatricopeptide repeat-containing protein At5g46100-like [Lotus japonicus]
MDGEKLPDSLPFVEDPLPAFVEEVNPVPAVDVDQIPCPQGVSSPQRLRFYLAKEKKKMGDTREPGKWQEIANILAGYGIEKSEKSASQCRRAFHQLKYDYLHPARASRTIPPSTRAVLESFLTEKIDMEMTDMEGMTDMEMVSSSSASSASKEKSRKKEEENASKKKKARVGESKLVQADPLAKARVGESKLVQADPLALCKKLTNEISGLQVELESLHKKENEIDVELAALKVAKAGFQKQKREVRKKRDIVSKRLTDMCETGGYVTRAFFFFEAFSSSFFCDFSLEAEDAEEEETISISVIPSISVISISIFSVKNDSNTTLVLGVSLNILIKALCKNKETIDSALQIFHEMPNRGCQPDSYTYGTLINGLCRMGSVSEAKELFKEMEEKGFSPSVVTYTSLIHGMCQSDNLGEAIRLLEEMKKNGIEPNVFTYSTLMDGLCKGGHSLQAMELLEMMVTKHNRPNMVTYGTLINGLCKEGKLSEAVEILDRMRLQGLKPNAGLYGKIISGFCAASSYQDAANFIDEMVLGGISPSRATWSLHVRMHNMVVQGLCSSVDSPRAFQLYLSMRTRGISIEIDTFDCLIKCFCKRGDLNKAARILEEMISDGCIPDKGIWDVVMGGLWDRKKVREASELWLAELKQKIVDAES